MKVYSIFISDLHLGNSDSNIDEFIKFIKTIETKKVFLVGDIVDTGSQSVDYCNWPESHKLALDLIIKKTRLAEESVYILGNHDSQAAKNSFLPGFRFNLLSLFQIKDKYIYESINNGHFLLMHGHQCDQVLDRASSIIEPLKWIYGKISFLKFIKRAKDKVKGSIAKKAGYPSAMIDIAKGRSCDGVISGHIHSPMIKDIDGLIYMNCGDWTGNNCALVELENGKFEIIG